MAAVVLAAGSSSRLGSNKLLIELAGETVVRRAARRALEAGLSPVIVVLGFDSERVAAALAGLPIEPVLNPRYPEGMHTSIQTGIGRVPDECGAAVVILADMPMVTAAMVAETVQRYRAGAPLVISLYGGVQAPPTLYSRAFFPAIVSAGAECGRRVLREHGDQAARIDWAPDLLADLDRPEDVAAIGTRLAEGPTG